MRHDAEALERVKIAEFIRRGHTITGLVHVGANNGYEVQWYLRLEISPILCFEPLMEAAEEFWIRYPQAATGVHLELMALGNVDGDVILHVTQGDGQGSSLLPELPADYHEVSRDVVEIARFATWAKKSAFDPALYNTLVIDVQGTELDVLRGMDDYLAGFQLLNIECSLEPVYRGGATAEEVITYLRKFGFYPITPIEPHNDILFVQGMP